MRHIASESAKKRYWQRLSVSCMKSLRFTKVVFRNQGVKFALVATICPMKDSSSLEEILAKRGRDVTIKFFASWCGSCVEELNSLRGKPRDESLLLLSTFDSPEAAGATLKRFQIRQDCYAGDSLARRLGVTHLPRTFIFTGGKFLPDEKR